MRHIAVQWWMSTLYLLFTNKVHTHNHLMAFVRDNQGRPVPEKTLTHSHPTWSSDILYHLPPFTTIHGILFVHFTCLTILLDNLSPGLPLGLGPWTSYSIHFFTQLSSSFFSTCPYQLSPFCCKTSAMSSIPSLSLSSLLGSLSFSLTPHIHLTILISARWSATTFSVLTGQASLPCNTSVSSITSVWPVAGADLGGD